MMRVAQRKTRLIFETDDFIFERGQNRQIVIDARASYCLMRLKGQRRAISAPYALLYTTAARTIAEMERRQKKFALKLGKKTQRGGK
jgi:hypothetical protein